MGLVELSHQRDEIDFLRRRETLAHRPGAARVVPDASPRPPALNMPVSPGDTPTTAATG